MDYQKILQNLRAIRESHQASYAACVERMQRMTEKAAAAGKPFDAFQGLMFDELMTSAKRYEAAAAEMQQQETDTFWAMVLEDSRRQKRTESRKPKVVLDETDEKPKAEHFDDLVKVEHIPRERIPRWPQLWKRTKPWYSEISNDELPTPCRCPSCSGEPIEPEGPTLPVPVTDLREGGDIHVLTDEIQRRSRATEQWAPWARRARRSRRYEGYESLSSFGRRR